MTQVRFGSPSQEYKIAGVTSDSREIRAGFAFVAVQGAHSDGHEFLQSAVQQGAALLVGEKTYPSGTFVGVPYLQVSDSRRALADLCAQFYGHPSHRMKLIGVTGTSGKTTTTYILESIFKTAGYSVGLIGTIHCRYGGVSIPSTHTTPGAPELQKILQQMQKAGVQVVIMEVSSHALKQRRADFLAFDGAIFTNLSSEHLDFHPDMEDYFESKKILFTDYAQYARSVGKRFHAAIHTHSSWGKRLSTEVSALPDVDLQSFDSSQIQGVRVNLSGLKTELLTPSRTLKIRSQLVGRYNLENILAAATLALQMEVSPEDVMAGVSNLRSVPGRLERVTDSGHSFQVFVDYAHKPDALEKVLQTLKLCVGEGRLLTVVGCGGDRDRQKRPLMGEIAERLSDLIWITSDNPRTEDPLQIIEEVKKGLKNAAKAQIEPDRKNAIQAVIRAARPGDVVLIAGKGHEDYQIIGKQKFPFDDRLEAQNALKLKES